MYIHYYEREKMNEGDNSPIGIVLYADKSDSIVKYTLPKDRYLHQKINYIYQVKKKF